MTYKKLKNYFRNFNLQLAEILDLVIFLVEMPPSQTTVSFKKGLHDVMRAMRDSIKQLECSFAFPKRKIHSIFKNYFCCFSFHQFLMSSTCNNMPIDWSNSSLLVKLRETETQPKCIL